jgi:hypothetical protein
MDADGDYIPRSVFRSEYSAKCWDEWKMMKYNGRPKAMPILRLYYEYIE